MVIAKRHIFALWFGVFALALMATVCAPLVTCQAQQPPRKIVIFYSDTGAGHKSAAMGIRDQILKENPGAQIIERNIWDFAPGWAYELKKIGWKMSLLKFPSLRDRGYSRAMKTGNETENLDDVRTYHMIFNKDKVYDFLSREAPDTVIATNYTSAEVLRTLRQQGLLQNMNVGWIYTDYAEGYWPRIAPYFDKVFLPHPGLVPAFEARGVPGDKLAPTGLPLSPYLSLPLDRAAFLKSRGLDPSVTTIMIAGGSDGAAPFVEMVKNIIAGRRQKKPVQFVVVCGRNEKAYDDLMQLSKDSPSRILPLRLVPPDEYLDYVKASDIYVVKAGGLSPTEGFAIGKPMVIYKAPGGGVESGNLEFFRQQGLAVVSDSVLRAGTEAAALLDDPEKQRSMLGAQFLFRSAMDIKRIVNFALQPPPGERVENTNPLNPNHMSRPSLELPFEQKGMLLTTTRKALQARIHISRMARKSLNYAMYLQRVDDVGLMQLALLRESARRGVRTRAVLDDQGARLVSKALLKHLIQEGVAIKLYHKRRLTDLRMYHRRLHDKFISADDLALIVGDKNAQNSYFDITPEKNRMNYSGLEVYVEGADAQNSSRYFDILWESDDVEDVTGLDDVSPAQLREAEKILNLYDDKKIASLAGDWELDFDRELEPVKSFKFVYDPVETLDNTPGIGQDLFNLMDEAREEIVMISPYFIMSDEFEAAVKRARERNVKITVYTNSIRSNDNPIVQAAYRRQLDQLHEMGIDVYEYKGKAAYDTIPTLDNYIKPYNLHTKVVYIDGGRKAYIGSYNLDPRAQRLNTEVGIVVEDKNFGRRLVEYKNSIHPNTWKVTRPRQSVAGTIKDSLLCNRLFELIVSPKPIRDFL